MVICQGRVRPSSQCQARIGSDCHSGPGRSCYAVIYQAWMAQPQACAMPRLAKPWIARIILSDRKCGPRGCGHRVNPGSWEQHAFALSQRRLCAGGPRPRKRDRESRTQGRGAFSQQGSFYSTYRPVRAPNVPQHRSRSQDQPLPGPSTTIPHEEIFAGIGVRVDYTALFCVDYMTIPSPLFLTPTLCRFCSVIAPTPPPADP